MEQTLGERIRKALKDQGLSEAELARRSGVPQPTVHRIVSGESKSPRHGSVQAIALALGLSATYLWSGEQEEATSYSRDPESYAMKTDAYEYLELRWEYVGMPVPEIPNEFFLSAPSHVSEAWATQDGYWLVVEGPSMVSDGPISFPTGMLILVYPGLWPASGRYVVAIHKTTGEATFKQFVRDAGRNYLKPLNPAFPMIEMDDNWELVGKVVDAKLPLNVLS